MGDIRSINAVKYRAACSLLLKVVNCKKSKIIVLWTAFRGNGFVASGLNGADHAFSGL